MPLAIGVVDDQEIFRRGLVAVLEGDPEMVVKVDLPTGPIEDMGLDVLVVSWRSLSTVECSFPIVLLENGDGAKSNRKPEAAAVLPRNDLTAERLVLAVRAAAAGLRVDANIVDDPRPRVLSGPRLEVIRLLATGADTRTIARRLSCSERTVKTYIRDVESALDAQTRAQAVAEAVRLGLV